MPKSRIIFRQRTREVIARRLRAARKQQDISGKALAASLGIRSDSLSQMERGKQTIPAELLVDWCNALRVSISSVTVGNTASEAIRKLPPRYAHIFSELPGSYQRYLLNHLETVAGLHLEESRRFKRLSDKKKAAKLGPPEK